MRRVALSVTALGLIIVLGGCSGGAQTVVTVTATPSSSLTGGTEAPVRGGPDSSAGEIASGEDFSSLPTESNQGAWPSDSIGSGTWMVPNEVQPGYYRVAGYWATLDADMEILDNDGVYEPGELTLAYVPASASFVEFSGEAVPVEALPVYPVMEILPSAGTYLVGADIEPGQYRVSGGDFAYAARLDERLEIIDNAGNEGSVIIIVKADDFAVSFSGEIERLK